MSLQIFSGGALPDNGAGGGGGDAAPTPINILDLHLPAGIKLTSNMCLINNNLVCCSSDGKAHFWNIETNTYKKSLQIEVREQDGITHYSNLYCVLAYNDFLIVGSSDGTIKMWNIATDSIIKILEGHTSYITHMCKLDNGNIASASIDGSVRLWDMSSGQFSILMDQYRNEWGNLISAGSLIAYKNNHIVCSYSRYTYVWDTVAKKVVMNLDNRTSIRSVGLDSHRHNVTCLSVLEDEYIISGDEKGTIVMWDPKTGNLLRLMSNNSDPILCMCELTHNSILAGSENYSLNIWDATSYEYSQGNTIYGRIINRVDKEILKTISVGESAIKEFLKIPTRNEIICMIGDKLAILNTSLFEKPEPVDESGVKIIKNPVLLTQIDVLRPNKLVGFSEEYMYIFNIDNEEPIIKVKLREAPTGICVLSNNNIVCKFYADLSIYNSEGKYLSKVNPSDKHAEYISSICELPDGNFISGSYDKSIRIWNSTTSQLVNTIKSDPITCMCIINRLYIACNDSKGDIVMYSISTGLRRMPSTYRGEKGENYTNICQVGANHFATVSDRGIRIWNIDTKECYILSGGSCICVYDPNHIIIGSDDGKITICDIRSRSIINRLAGHTDIITNICTLPDGRIVSNSNDGTSRIWPRLTLQSGGFKYKYEKYLHKLN